LPVGTGTIRENGSVPDWDGARYGEISALQRAMAEDSLALLELDGGERVLDVGCGDGWVTTRIAERLPHGSVLGLDPSPRMVEAARRRVPDDASSPGPPAVATFVVGDVVAMTFDAEFDVVTSFNALHWVTDQAAAYRAIASALRPDGRALVTFVCAGPRRSVEDVAMAVARGSRWAASFGDFVPPYRHPTVEAFTATAGDAGLEAASTSVRDVEWDFGSREAFAAWCAVGFGDWTGRLSPQLAGQFVDEVVDRYAEVIGRPGVFGFYQLRARLSRAAGT
jgi:trans-aconitate 2-methyltransferase